MKVVCIDVSYERSGTGLDLTLHKVYDTTSMSHPLSDAIYVINDIGENAEYYEGRFITLEEWREKKLNEILKNDKNPCGFLSF